MSAIQNSIRGRVRVLINFSPAPTTLPGASLLIVVGESESWVNFYCSIVLGKIILNSDEVICEAISRLYFLSGNW